MILRQGGRQSSVEEALIEMYLEMPDTPMR
jgi:hypothetical protein